MIRGLRMFRLIAGRHELKPEGDVTMWAKIRAKLAESWKAILALAIPIGFGAAAEFIDAVGKWVADSGSVWSGVTAGLLTSVGVWLKANRPA